MLTNNYAKMPLPFTGPILNAALQTYLREHGYQQVEANIPGVGTCIILDYRGKHPFRTELRFRKAPRNPVDGTSNNTSNTINLDIMIDQYLGERANANGFEAQEGELFSRVLQEIQEMSRKNPDYRIMATGEYNPEHQGHPLYPGKKVRRLSIIFPTKRTKDPGREDPKHPEKSIDWAFLTAAYPFAIDYIHQFAIRYFGELDKAFPK